MDLHTYTIGTSKINNERALVISDILDVANKTPGIKRKITPRNAAVFLSPIKTPDLYALLSNMKKAKNPAAYFWWTVKKK